jgi:hypothetical protein
MKTNDRMLTVREAVQRIYPKLSARQVRRLCANGTLKADFGPRAERHTHHGRTRSVLRAKWLIDPESLAAFNLSRIR